MSYLNRLVRPLLAALALAAGGGRAAAQTAADPVVASAAGLELRLSEFELAFRRHVADRLAQAGRPFDEASLATFAGERPRVLEMLVREELALRQAAREGLLADAGAVAGAWRELEARLPDEAARTAALAAAGYRSPDEYRRAAARSLSLERLERDLTVRLRFGEAVLRAVYLARRTELRGPTRACASYILVATEAAARSALARLARGETFAAVARAVSIDPGSRPDGGDLGCFGPGGTPAAFDRAVFEGPVGRVQGPVRTPAGYQLVLVTWRNPAPADGVEGAYGRVHAILARRAFERYVDALVERAKVRTFLERLGTPNA